MQRPDRLQPGRIDNGESSEEGRGGGWGGMRIRENKAGARARLLGKRREIEIEGSRDKSRFRRSGGQEQTVYVSLPIYVPRGSLNATATDRNNSLYGEREGTRGYVCVRFNERDRIRERHSKHKGRADTSSSSSSSSLSSSSRAGASAYV